MFTIYCDSISFNKVTSLVDRMSYYCLKKTSTEIELMTTLGTENDLLHSKTFDRERKFDSYIYTSYIKVNRVMGLMISELKIIRNLAKKNLLNLRTSNLRLSENFFITSEFSPHQQTGVEKYIFIFYFQIIMSKGHSPK